MCREKLLWYATFYERQIKLMRFWLFCVRRQKLSDGWAWNNYHFKHYNFCSRLWRVWKRFRGSAWKKSRLIQLLMLGHELRITDWCWKIESCQMKWKQSWEGAECRGENKWQSKQKASSMSWRCEKKLTHPIVISKFDLMNGGVVGVMPSINAINECHILISPTVFI